MFQVKPFNVVPYIWIKFFESKRNILLMEDEEVTYTKCKYPNSGRYFIFCENMKLKIFNKSSQRIRTLLFTSPMP